MPLESSAAESEKPVEGDAPATQDANTAAQSSGADDKAQGANEPSLMDAVIDRLEKDTAGDSPPPDKSGQTEADSGTDAKADAAKDGESEGDGEEDAEKDPPFHEHPAWKRQIAKRQELETQVSDLTPRAERFDQMQSMMTEANLTNDEVSTGFNIMALMKNDPHEALAALKPFYDSLLAVTGEVLPEELQTRVDDGRMTEEDARELARARSQSAVAERRATATEERSQQDAKKSVMAEMANGVTAWETEWQKSDPDYSQKLPFVEAKIQAMRASGRLPRNRDEAVQLAKDARTEVEKDLKVFVPKKPAIKPTPDGSSVTAISAPKSSLEAAKAALDGMR